MSLSYYLLERNAINVSTSMSEVSSVDLADGFSGMQSLVFVILKSSMHSSKFITVLQYSKQLGSKMHYIHLQITTTGINKQTKSDIIQPRLQFLECWHRFYHKSQNFPINLCDSWLCFLFSVLTLGWPMLRCFKNVP